MRVLRGSILWAFFVALALVGCADSSGMQPGGTFETVPVEEGADPGTGTTNPADPPGDRPGDLPDDPLPGDPPQDSSLAIYTITPDKGSASGMEQVEIQTTEEVKLWDRVADLSEEIQKVEALTKP